MSIAKARDFIRKIQRDDDFRKSCYKYKTKSELEKEFGFNALEFEEVIHSMLFKCQEYEQADNVRQLQMWFLLFK